MIKSCMKRIKRRDSNVEDKNQDMIKKMGIKEWIFCIAGIIIFTSFMVLPPVFRLAFPVEKIIDKKTEPSQKPEKPEGPITVDDSSYDKIVCRKTLETNEISEITLSHEEKKLQIYTEKNTQSYQSISEEEFSKIKTDCDYPQSPYLRIEGFQYICENQDRNITITKKYDLKKFANTTVTMEDGSIELISVPYLYNQNIDNIQKQLENNQYSCQISK